METLETNERVEEIVMGRRAKKTPMMLREETRLGKPLEAIIPETYKKYGSLEATSEALGIKVNTLYLWMCKLGIAIHKTIVT